MDGAAVIGGLLNLCDNQVCRNGTSTACNRRDGQCRCGSFGISHRQNRIDHSGFHDCHPDNLRNSRCASCNGVTQILTVQRQDQLTCLGHTHLKQYLIGSDLRQSEGAVAGTDNTRSAVRTVLRETDIGTGCNSSGVVRRHQRIEIRKTQYATRKTLWSNRASLTHRPLRTGRTSITYRTLRTNGADFTSRTLRANGADFTSRTLGTGRTGCTNGTLRTGWAGCASRALRTGRASYTSRTLGANRASNTHKTLRTSRPHHSSRALWTNWACFTHGTLRANRAGSACRPLRTDRSGNARRTLRSDSAGIANRSLWTHWTRGTFRTLRANRTSWAWNPLRASRTSWAAWPLRTGRALLPWWTNAAAAIAVVFAAGVVRVVPFCGQIPILRFILRIRITVVSVHHNPSLQGVYCSI